MTKFETGKTYTMRSVCDLTVLGHIRLSQGLKKQ